MYFAIDLDNRVIVNEDGDTFTVERFKQIVEDNAEKETYLDMTLMTQRFVRMGYDIDALIEFYEVNK